jgi:hypothetical protein
VGEAGPFGLGDFGERSDGRSPLLSSRPVAPLGYGLAVGLAAEDAEDRTTGPVAHELDLLPPAGLERVCFLLAEVAVKLLSDELARRDVNDLQLVGNPPAAQLPSGRVEPPSRAS